MKTAVGDLDYAVTLKYGGKTDALGRIGSVNFPLIHTEKINVERSVVQLHLPENYRWLHFGGTMHPGAEATVTAAVLSYQTDQIERLMEAARQADPFAQECAKNNLKQFGLAMAAYREHFGSYIGRDAEAAKGRRTNDEVRKTAEGLLEQADKAAAQTHNERPAARGQRASRHACPRLLHPRPQRRQQHGTQLEGRLERGRELGPGKESVGADAAAGRPVQSRMVCE